MKRKSYIKKKNHNISSIAACGDTEKQNYKSLSQREHVEIQKPSTCISLASYTPKAATRPMPIHGFIKAHCSVPLPSRYKLPHNFKKTIFLRTMEDCVDELLNSLSDYKKVDEAEEDGQEAEEKVTSKASSGGGLIEQIISHLPVAIPGISDNSAAARESIHGDNDMDKPEAKKAEEPEGMISLPVDSGPDPEEATILISIIHD